MTKIVGLLKMTALQVRKKLYYKGFEKIVYFFCTTHKITSMHPWFKSDSQYSIVLTKIGYISEMESSIKLPCALSYHYSELVTNTSRDIKNFTL